MPSSSDILEGLTAIANQWQSVAVAWHAALGALLLGLFSGWRPPRRAVGASIALSLGSVGVLAWTSGNPFNAVVFGALSGTLALIAVRLPRTRVEMGSPAVATLGAGMVAFGWIYPHFLETDSWFSYLYAAPPGLIPCPTLAAAIGLTLIVGLSESRTWAKVLASAGLVYGVIGVFRLGVVIDLVLIAAGIILACTVTSLNELLLRRSVPATASAKELLKS